MKEVSILIRFVGNLWGEKGARKVSKHRPCCPLCPSNKTLFVILAIFELDIGPRGDFGVAIAGGKRERRKGGRYVTESSRTHKGRKRTIYHLLQIAVYKFGGN